jgi:Replication Fork Protection Component Swi3
MSVRGSQTAVDEPPAPLEATEELAGSKKRAKPRPEYAKLDADRLLSDQGLPKLMSMFSKARFRSTNQFENLDKIMRIYQIWGQVIVS